MSVLISSRGMSGARPQRNFACFARWVERARIAERLAVAACGKSTSTATRAIDRDAVQTAWRRASRAVAARVAMACARERLVDGTWANDSLVLRPLGISLPLARLSAFELHEPELDAPRAATLEDPVALLDALWPTLSAVVEIPRVGEGRVRAELEDCVFNLALNEYAAGARHRVAAERGEVGPSPALIDSEQLPTAGHPWHPLCKTRLGLSLRENLLHAPELLGDGSFLAVDIDAAHAATSGRYLELAARVLPTPPKGQVRVPVHPAQLRRLPALLGRSFGQVVRAVALPHGSVRARALLSTRTVVVDAPRVAARLHVKLAVNVLTTSATRTVSPMSQINGPRVSALLERIRARDPETRGRVLIQPDGGGAGLLQSRYGDAARQLGVILRESHEPLARALVPEPARTPRAWVCAALGERPPGGARCLLAELAAGYPGAPQARGEAMIADYVNALAPPLLRMLTAHGVALEAHLQNTLVVSDGARVRGFLIRDLGGIRVHRPRLRAAGHSLELAPGSFIATDSLEEVQRKLSHVLFHAHLAAVFSAAARSLAIPERRCWALTRDVVARALTTWSRDPALRAACERDRVALLAPRCHAKALFHMRLLDRSSDYRYTVVDNALAGG